MYKSENTKTALKLKMKSVFRPTSTYGECRLAAETAADTHHSLRRPTRFTAGPVFVFGPLTALLFGPNRIFGTALIFEHALFV